MTDRTELKRLAEACPVDDTYRLVEYHCDWFLRTDDGIVFTVHRNSSFPQFKANNEAYAALAAAATPAVILDLLAENERLTSACSRAEQVINDECKKAAVANGRANLLETERDQLKAEVARSTEREILQLAEIEALRRRIADDEKKLDALLNHCDDGECATCGQIICPHGDGMHFHHDGCPACAQADGITVSEEAP